MVFLVSSRQKKTVRTTLIENKPSPQLIDSGTYWYEEKIANYELDPADFDAFQLTINTSSINSNYKIGFQYWSLYGIGTGTEESDNPTGISGNKDNSIIIVKNNFKYDIFNSKINTDSSNIMNTERAYFIIYDTGNTKLGWIQIGYNSTNSPSSNPDDYFYFYFTSSVGHDLPSNIYTYNLYAYRDIIEFQPYVETQTNSLPLPNINNTKLNRTPYTE